MERLPYKTLVSKWKKVRCGKLFRAGETAGYPIYGWKYDGGGPLVYLSAGIHGDEPAGPMAVTKLFEEMPAWFLRFSWIVFPCLNPWGYERGLRRNAKRLDVNRLWRENREQEVRAVRKTIRAMTFELAYLMHEDYDAKGFYLYELCMHGASTGEAIVGAVRSILPVEPRRSIEGRRTTRRGLIRRGPSHRLEARKLWPEAFYLVARHTRHLFTAETPSTGFELRLRILAQIKGLRVALGPLKSPSDKSLPNARYRGKSTPLQP
jgi:murein peptide amidase A